jgi:alpha-1,2-glucosyltransferase
MTHWVQVLYFSFFAGCFSGVTIGLSKRILSGTFSNLRGIVSIAVLIPLAALLKKYFTFAHPFILSDNRHYTFYIWKRAFEHRPLLRYYLTIPDAISAVSVTQIPSKYKALISF